MSKFYVYMIGSKVFRTTLKDRIEGRVRIVRLAKAEDFITMDYDYIPNSVVDYYKVFTVCGRNFNQVVRFLKRNWHKKHKHGKKGGVK